MSHVAIHSFSPLRLPERAIGWRISAVLVGVAILAISSHVKVPMYPVPMTAQTLAVTLIGALYGWRLGALTVLAWLGGAALGLPFLAGGGGAHHFVGPTAGYLAAFPLAAALTGWLAERGWNGRRVALAFAAMLLGNALCLVLGAAWLASRVGVENAVVVGVLPFVLGGVVKSALAAATLKALPR